MAEYVIRLPDVGEGVAEAELVEWHVKIGDLVREDTALAAVMTDKATVEIPSPVEGEIVWLGGEIGDKVAVGSDLVRLKVPTDRKTPVTTNNEPELPQASTSTVEVAAKRTKAESILPESVTSPPVHAAPYINSSMELRVQRAKNPSPLRLFVSARAMPELICGRFRVPVRPVASCMRIWMRSSTRGRAWRERRSVRQGLRSKTSR